MPSSPASNNWLFYPEPILVWRSCSCLCCVPIFPFVRPIAIAPDEPLDSPFLCSEEGRTYSCKAPRHWGHVPGHPSPPSRKSSLTTAQGESHRQILALSDARCTLLRNHRFIEGVGTALRETWMAAERPVPVRVRPSANLFRRA